MRWTVTWLMMCVAGFAMAACADAVVREDGAGDDESDMPEGPTYSNHHDERGGKCLAVATSASPHGPFQSAGEPLLCGVYHAIDRAQPRRDTGVPGVLWDRRVMLMDRIVYLSGWPRIQGRRPSSSAAAPVISETGS